MAEINYRLCGELRVQIGAEFTAHEEGGAEMIEHHETLRNDLTSVRYAREQVSKLLETNDETLRDSACLLVSEVVTNALIHTAGEVTLTVRTEPGWLRVEIGDKSPRVPLKKTVRATATGGRGMELVDVLSKDWGVDPYHNGKIVWFELESKQAKKTRDALLETINVKLRNVDTKLVSESLEHSDQMLHEMLVLSATNEDVEIFALTGEIELGLIAERARQEYEEGHPRSSISVDLPFMAGDMVNAMILALDEADVQAAQGNLLTPPATPEMRECRTSILREISQQLNTVVPQQFMPTDNSDDDRPMRFEIQTSP